MKLPYREFCDAFTDCHDPPIRGAVPAVDGVARPATKCPYGEVEEERRNRPDDHWARLIGKYSAIHSRAIRCA